ncbi:unnamed protein product [Arctia plantaginis]|uniref:aralkylamine N-acetyltransferase n=1 Tax=Arctia plantaginis TaxID=874455 RepID=A0A8S1BAB5_ARCPL|nr:unnamed protein product [Arctia plantaginis]
MLNIYNKQRRGFISIAFRQNSNRKHENKILKSVYKDLPVTNYTVNDFVWENLDRWPDKTATVCAVTGHGYTYAQTQRMSVTFAAALRNKIKLQTNDKVAVILPNVPEYPCTILGILQAGCIASMMNPIYSSEELKHQIQLINCKALVTSKISYQNVRKALSELKLDIPVITTDNEMLPGAVKFAELAEDFNIDTSCLKSVHRSPKDLEILPYSSGTTGLPNAMVLTHQGVVALNQQIAYPEVVAIKEKTAIFLGKRPAVTPKHLETLYSIIRGAAPLSASDIEAVIAKNECAETKKTYTYAQLQKYSSVFATSLLKKLGLKPGDVLAVMIPNCPEFPVVAFGSIQAGVVLTTVNPIYKEFEIAHQISITEPKAIVTIQECYDTVKTTLKNCKKDIKIILIDNPANPVPNDAIRYSEIAESGAADYELLDKIEKKTDEVACIPFSSGTTGLPKGVEITYGNLLASLEIMHQKEVCYPVLTHAILLGKHPDVNKEHSRNVRHICCGAAPLSASDVEAIQQKSKLADELPSQLSELNLRSMSQPSYTICTIKDNLNDKQRMLKFLRRFFFRDEPMNLAVNLLETPESVCLELEEYVASSLEDGVSVAAVDEDGEYVGVIVNGIVRKEEVDYTDKSADCPNPKFRQILRVLGYLDREAKMWEKLPKDCNTVLELRIAATHSEWRGRGLVKALCAESERLAKSNGAGATRMDTTSAFSVAVAERLNYKKIFSVRYSDLDFAPQPEEPHVEARRLLFVCLSVFIYIILVVSRRMSRERIEIKPVRTEDENDVMDLIRRTFYIDEPMNQAVALCVDGTCKELDEYCAKALRAGLSFKAVDGDGNVVGTIVNEICSLKEDTGSDNPYLKMAQECQNPKFQKILYVLAKREDGARFQDKFPNDQQYMDVKIAATDPNFRNRGIMKDLLKATENLATQRGIRVLRMDTSSAYSAMSAKRLGFTCVHSAPYTDLKMDGQPILVPEAPHVDDSVYVKLMNV